MKDQLKISKNPLIILIIIILYCIFRYKYVGIHLTVIQKLYKYFSWLLFIIYEKEILFKGCLLLTGSLILFHFDKDIQFQHIQYSS